MNRTPPTKSEDLRPSEHRFVSAMQRFDHCHFESLRIQHGELVLDPWPVTVQEVKFGSGQAAAQTLSDEFELKRQVVQFFEYVRSVDNGTIRSLEVKHGLPFSMEIQTPNPGADGG